LGLHASGHIEINHARFHDHARIGNIHFEDTIHPRKAEDDAVFHGQRAAAQACAGAARDKRNSFAMANLHDGLNLLRGSGKQDRARQYAKIREAVAFVSVQLLGRGNEAAVADDRAEFAEDGGVHRATSLKHITTEFGGERSTAAS